MADVGGRQGMVDNGQQRGAVAGDGRCPTVARVADGGRRWPTIAGDSGI
ncbi:hypothetical protein Dimus_016816 [Dionaea muscipula]